MSAPLVPYHRRGQTKSDRCYQCNGPLGSRSVRLAPSIGPAVDLCGPKCGRAYDACEPLACGPQPLTAADIPVDMDPREARAALAEWRL
jgi:hypothetical protein